MNARKIARTKLERARSAGLNGNLQIVVISRKQEPNDLECFRSIGIDPRKLRYLMLSRSGFNDGEFLEALQA